MLDKINKFLTPAKRKAIYGIVAALVAALIAFDVVSPEDLSGTVQAIVTILAGLSSIMAFVNVSPGPHDG
jgi:hypothetical protein